MDEEVILATLRSCSDTELIGILIKIAVTSYMEADGGDFEKDKIRASDMWDKTQVILEERGLYYNISSFEVFMQEFCTNEHRR